MSGYGSGTIYQRGRIWWIAYWSHGKQHFESSKSRHKGKARELLNQRLHEGLDPGADPKITVGDLTALLVKHYERSQLSSLKQLRSRLKHINPALGKVKACDVTPAKLTTYQDARLSTGAAIATVNRELDAIRRAFSLAIEAGTLTKAPKVRLLPENNVRTGFMDHGGYQTLKGLLPSHLRLLFVIAYHLGLRLGEIRRLAWDQVDLKGGVIYLWTGTTKNKQGRTAPIYGDLAAELEMAMAVRDAEFPDCPWVCQHWGEQLGDFRKSWKTATRAAKVPGLHPHDLRRTAVRNMIRAGIPEKVVMQILGHKTRAMLDRYNIINERDLREAGAKMDRWLGEQPKATEEKGAIH